MNKQQEQAKNVKKLKNQSRLPLRRIKKADIIAVG
jgi:hypothetical protein